MYYITNDDRRSAIDAALSSPERQFKNKIEIGSWSTSTTPRSFVASRTIQDGFIRFVITQTVNAESDGLTFGNACCSSLELELYTQGVALSVGSIIKVFCGIYLTEDDESSIDYIPCGYFRVDKAETSDNWQTAKITAYDDLYGMTDSFNTSLDYANDNIYASTVITEICTHFGKIGIAADKQDRANLPTSTSYSVLASRRISATEASVLTGYTYREVLGILAGLVGANAHMDTTGRLAITRPYQHYDEPELTADVQWQEGFQKTASTFTVSSITSGSGESSGSNRGVFTKGTGAGIKFVNPLISESEITAIKNAVVGNGVCDFTTFQPCSVKWRGHPCVEAGDVVTVKDKNNTSYTVIIAEQELDLTGGLISNIKCPPGDAEIEFDTVEDRTRRMLNSQKTDLQQRIAEVTAALNGANGGAYTLLDTDVDGNPDGWCIEDGIGHRIIANVAGIGLSDSNGANYRSAIDYQGIHADEIYTGKLRGGNGLSWFDLDTGEICVQSKNTQGSAWAKCTLHGLTWDASDGSVTELKAETESGTEIGRLSFQRTPTVNNQYLLTTQLRGNDVQIEGIGNGGCAALKAGNTSLEVYDSGMYFSTPGLNCNFANSVINTISTQFSGSSHTRAINWNNTEYSFTSKIGVGQIGTTRVKNDIWTYNFNAVSGLSGKTESGSGKTYYEANNISAINTAYFITNFYGISSNATHIAVSGTAKTDIPDGVTISIRFFDSNETVLNTVALTNVTSSSYTTFYAVSEIPEDAALFKILAKRITSNGSEKKLTFYPMIIKSRKYDVKLTSYPSVAMELSSGAEILSRVDVRPKLKDENAVEIWFRGLNGNACGSIEVSEDSIDWSGGITAQDYVATKSLHLLTSDGSEYVDVYIEKSGNGYVLKYGELTVSTI